MANVVTVSGMFGAGHSYFANSPVVIDISGLLWPTDQQTGKLTSPFNVVRIEVIYKKVIAGGYQLVKVGDFHSDTGGQSTFSMDISSALRAIWSDADFTEEVAKAQAATASDDEQTAERPMRQYMLRIYTEYQTSDGVFKQERCTDEQGNTDIPGGQCLTGGYTELERSLISNDADRDVSHLEHTGVRYGDASTKPTSTPERVGRDSITSWVDVQVNGTKSIFYPANAMMESDDIPEQQRGWTGHAPIVLRDSVAYTDFLFLNRRGAIETCSALMKEAMDINVQTQEYSKSEGPSFRPSRTLMAIGSDGRRSWQMSSGFVSREWAEWWTQEFLAGKRKQWWMLWQGPGMAAPRFVPVSIKPTKADTSIYDRAKQQMSSVEFTVTLALEG